MTPLPPFFAASSRLLTSKRSLNSLPLSSLFPYSHPAFYAPPPLLFCVPFLRAHLLVSPFFTLTDLIPFPSSPCLSTSLAVSYLPLSFPLSTSISIVYVYLYPSVSLSLPTSVSISTYVYSISIVSTSISISIVYFYLYLYLWLSLSLCFPLSTSLAVSYLPRSFRHLANPPTSFRHVFFT